VIDVPYVSFRLDNQSAIYARHTSHAIEHCWRIELMHSVAPLPGAVAVTVAGVFDRPSLSHFGRGNAAIFGNQRRERGGRPARPALACSLLCGSVGRIGR
jgi:hypothetical protein